MGYPLWTGLIDQFSEGTHICVEKVDSWIDIRMGVGNEDPQKHVELVV